jgi:hypothetical protein
LVERIVQRLGEFREAMVVALKRIEAHYMLEGFSQ